jgi:diaminopimelate epimerase
MIQIDNIIITHGSLNKFVMIDEINTALNINNKQRKTLTINLCSKKYFDTNGVLYIQKSSNDQCIAKMSMYNTDGTQAQMCGNGIRCVARYIYEKYNQKDFFIQTPNDKIAIKKATNIYKNIPTFDALIGPISLDITTLPMTYDSEEFINQNIKSLSKISNFTAISVQNPHIVFIKDKINLKEVIEYEKILNNNKIFPQQVNLNFVEILNKDSIFVLTNERGSGITPSCGTGMSSSTYIVCLLKYCEFNNHINVYNNGGKVICKATKNSIHLIGNATYIEKNSITIDENMNISSNHITHKYTNETKIYNEFLKYCNKYKINI